MTNSRKETSLRASLIILCGLVGAWCAADKSHFTDGGSADEYTPETTKEDANPEDSSDSSMATGIDSLLAPDDEATELEFDSGFDGFSGDGTRCGLDVLDEGGGIRACWSDVGPQRVSTLCDEDRGICVGPRARCTNGWCHVPPRLFLAGFTGAVGERSSHLPTAIRRSSQGLWVQQTETTLGAFKAVMGYEPDFTSSCGDDCPVAGVSIFEAMAYANRLSEAAGLPTCYELEACGVVWLAPFGSSPDRPARSWACEEARFLGDTCGGYRLPSQSEWEHFARAGSPYCFPLGPAGAHFDSPASDLPIASEFAIYRGTSGVEYRPCPIEETGAASSNICIGPKPSRSTHPNAYGLYEVFGNVEEHTMSTLDLDELMRLRDTLNYAGLPPYDTDSYGGFTHVVRRDTPMIKTSGLYYDDAMATCGHWLNLGIHDAPAVSNQAIGFRLVRNTTIRFKDP